MSNETNWEPIQIPSLGMYYGEACPDGVVHITPWTTAQEEMIIRHSEQEGEGLIDKLISSNVKFPEGLRYEDLLVTDQHFILMKLRAISITCFYAVDYKCPSCKHTTEIQYNIDELPRKTPEETPEWDEPFEVLLPKCRTTVGIRHMRVSDEKAIKQYVKQKSDAGIAQDDRFVYRMARKIVSVGGNEDIKFEEKKAFVRGLIMLDVEVIRDFAERFETGLDIEVTAKCSKCKDSIEWSLPLQHCFFRPKRSDIEAEMRALGES